jgi:pyrroline-5-carboxylate reductase
MGAGQMARAFAAGMLQAGLTEAGKIVAFDPADAARQAFAEQLPGAQFAADNRSVIAAADLVVLAVKPQQAATVMSETHGALGGDKLLVSIVAGLPLVRLAAGFGTDRVVRVMPNTPCLVGCGASAYALGLGATSEDGELVDRLLSAVGVSVRVEEAQLDAVTGLSGSGPAFVYTMIEALSDGGVRMGLARPVATRLAAQTVLGAAQMVLVTKEHPGVLKDRVASPGGTTIAGLQALEDRGVRGAVMAAVEAAAKRSAELGHV